MKICKICLIDKSLDQYSKSKSYADGYRSQCVPCRNEQRKKRYYKRNYLPDLTLEAKHCSKCQVMVLIENFYPCIRYKDGYANVCIYCKKHNSKDYYKKSSDKVKARTINYYYSIGKVQRKPANRKRQKERISTEPLYKLKRRLRNRLYCALRNKGWTKNNHLNDYIGCDYSTLINHIGSKFTPEMNWENHGSVFEIDHIYPLSLAKTEEEMYKLCHYTNLQPLLIADNRKKGNKII